MVTLIATAKLNDVDPQAWLADVLARIAPSRTTASPSCSPGTGEPKWQIAATPPDQPRALSEIAHPRPRRTVTPYSTG